MIIGEKLITPEEASRKVIVMNISKRSGIAFRVLQALISPPQLHQMHDRQITVECIVEPMVKLISQKVTLLQKRG